jgi:hypothetical protein
MSTPKQISANRENARKSTGPSSARGKAASSHNASNHGLRSKQLLVPESDRAKFEELRHQLVSQLKPRGALEEFYCEEILICIWKLKMLARFELQSLSRFARETDADPAEESGLRELPSKTDLRAQIKFLEAVKAEVHSGGDTPIRGNFREPIITVFGEPFYRMLVEWDTSNLLTLTMLETFQKKAELYDFPPSELEIEAKQESPKIIQDPHLKSNMIEKLITLKQEYLQEMSRLKDSLSTRTTDSLSTRIDLQLRYSTAIKRDLWKAIEHLYELREAQ